MFQISSNVLKIIINIVIGHLNILNRTKNPFDNNGIFIKLIEQTSSSGSQLGKV